jgi:myo-inositol 2-dehydrogenase/D-chiro-inositol 1-dehydrogenase
VAADTQTISIGIIGTGAIGGTHAKNLHSKIVGAKIGAVMDTNLASAEAVAAACGSARVFRDADELIRSKDVDAILIASPDHLHAEYVLKSLRANKPVFCEKPLATTLADAHKIVSTEVELGRKLVQVGFMRRYDPAHLGVKRAIEAGAIGRPVLFKGWHRNVGIPYAAASEIILVNSAIHDLDSARWLLGQEIEQAYVVGTNVEPAHGQACLDLQLLQLSLSRGCLAIIEVNVSASYGYEVGVEVVGDKGTAISGPPPGPIIRRDRAYTGQIEDIWFDRFAAAYLAELEAWVASIKSDNATGPNAWDGYISLLAAQTCIMALQSGVPQRLPPYEQPALYMK